MLHIGPLSTTINSVIILHLWITTSLAIFYVPASIECMLTWFIVLVTMPVMIFRRSSMDAAEGENLLFQTSWSGVVLSCYPHRLHCLVPRREQQDGQRGPLSYRVKEGESKKTTTTTTIPSLSSLDMPSKQRLVIKLTSQQASALAFASWSIVMHWGGNSSFQGIPGQKA